MTVERYGLSQYAGRDAGCAGKPARGGGHMLPASVLPVSTRCGTSDVQLLPGLADARTYALVAQASADAGGPRVQAGDDGSQRLKGCPQALYKRYTCRLLITRAGHIARLRQPTGLANEKGPPRLREWGQARHLARRQQP